MKNVGAEIDTFYFLSRTWFRNGYTSLHKTISHKFCCLCEVKSFLASANGSSIILVHVSGMYVLDMWHTQCLLPLHMSLLYVIIHSVKMQQKALTRGSTHRVIQFPASIHRNFELNEPLFLLTYFSLEYLTIQHQINQYIWLLLGLGLTQGGYRKKL